MWPHLQSDRGFRFISDCGARMFERRTIVRRITFGDSEGGNGIPCLLSVRSFPGDF